MRFLAIFVALGFFHAQAWAQKSPIDSLKFQLSQINTSSTFVHDTTQASLLNKIAWEYCRLLFESTGRTLVNASRRSELEHVTRVDFDELFPH